MTDQEEALLALGVRLRKLRHATGMTQGKVGYRAGFSQASIGSMERGRYGVLTVATVEKLAGALEYTVEEVLEGTGYEPPEKGVYPPGHGRHRHDPASARAPQSGQVHPLVQELRRVRQKSLTQRQMALRLGVTQPTINSWEYGLSQVTVGNLAEWAEALGFELKLVPKEES